MKMIKTTMMVGLLLMGCCLPQTVRSETVTMINQAGEQAYLEVGSSDQFFDVLQVIQSYCDEHESVPAFAYGHNPLDQAGYLFEVSHAGITVRSKKEAWRDYGEAVSKSDKKDIAFIVTTLATGSKLTALSESSSLKKAGKRIERVHPLRFLMTVFNDEELKAGVHAIRDVGGMIGDGFFDPLVDTLKEEAARGNVLQFTADFAEKVNIDPALIQPSMEKGKWKDFVDTLIDQIPRKINPNRYDM